MRKTALWIILISQLCTSMALAETPFEKAVQLYNQKDYKAVLTVLEPLVRSEKQKDAVAHYYLANTYANLGRQADALAEYRASYAIDPKGEAAVLCLQAIAQFTAAQSSGTARQPAAGSATTDAASAEATKPAVTIDDRAVVSKLPGLPVQHQPAVTLAQVQQWSDQRRSDYMFEAQSKIPKATEKAQKAEKLLAYAESVVASLVPNSKAYGESEEALAARRKAGQERVDQLLAPYRQYLSTCQTNLEQSKAIFEACQTSNRGYNGWMPVGR